MFGFLTSLGSALKDLLPSVMSAIGIGVNSKTQQEVNQANANINQTNLDYNAAMTQQQWERDDNAHQREVADLEKAGLSPIAATGGANTSAALGAPAAIAMQAPQLDFNSLTQSMLQTSELNEKVRHNKAEEGIQNTQLQQNAEEIELKTKQLKLEDEKVQKNYEIQTRTMKIQSDSLSETIRANKKNEEIKLSEEQRKQLEYEAQEMLRYIKRHTGRDDVPYEWCNDEKDYANKVELRQQAYLKVLDQIENYKTSSASGSSSSMNGSGGAASVNLSAGASSSKYSSESKDKSIYAQELLKKFEQDYPFPIPDFEEKYSKKKD